MSDGALNFDPSHHVSMEMPGSPDYLSLARLHLGWIASRLSFGFSDIEDLFLAIDELCLCLMNEATPIASRLVIDVQWSREQIYVNCRLRLSTVPPGFLDDQTSNELPHSISRLILNALVDEHGRVVRDGEPSAWFTKRRNPTVSTS